MKEKIKLLWEKYQKLNEKQKAILLISIVVVLIIIAGVVSSVKNNNSNNKKKGSNVNTVEINNDIEDDVSIKNGNNIDVEITIGKTLEYNVDLDNQCAFLPMESGDCEFLVGKDCATYDDDDEDVILTSCLNKYSYGEKPIVCTYNHQYQNALKIKVLSISEFLTSISDDDAEEGSKIAYSCSNEAISNSNDSETIIKKYNQCLKRHYDELLKGIDPSEYTSYFETYDLDDYKKVNLELTTLPSYFLYKNAEEKNERSFFKKMLINYITSNDFNFKDNLEADYHKYSKYFVTLYPVKINGKFAYYAIVYDLVSGRGTNNSKLTEDEILKVYSKMRKEADERIKNYPLTYTENELGIIVPKIEEHYTLKDDKWVKTDSTELNQIEVKIGHTINSDEVYKGFLKSNLITQSSRYNWEYLDSTKDFINKEETTDYYEIVKKNFKNIINGKYKTVDKLMGLEK